MDGSEMLSIVKSNDRDTLYKIGHADKSMSFDCGFNLDNDYAIELSGITSITALGKKIDVCGVTFSDKVSSEGLANDSLIFAAYRVPSGRPGFTNRYCQYTDTENAEWKNIIGMLDYGVGWILAGRVPPIGTVEVIGRSKSTFTVVAPSHQLVWENILYWRQHVRI